MKNLFKYAALFLFILLFSTQAHGAAAQWEVDPAHSAIYFSIDHIYSTTRGYFEDFKAAVKFSPDDPDGSSIHVEVDVKSINTGNSKRDSHLNTADFFDSGKYPKMTFTSTAVKHVKKNQYMVEGKMTVKDVTKTVSVPFTFLGVTNHPFNKKLEVAGFEAKMTIDRLAYHVGGGKFYDMGVVGKNVEVLITMEVTRPK